MGVNLFFNYENPIHVCCIDAQDIFDLIDEHRLDRLVTFGISRVALLEPLTAELDHCEHSAPSLRVTLNLPATSPLAAAVFRYGKKAKNQTNGSRKGLKDVKGGKRVTRLLTTLRAAL